MDRARALEKLLELERAAADEVDESLVAMIGENRRLARENVAMRCAIFDALAYFSAAGVEVGRAAEMLEAAATKEG